MDVRRPEWLIDRSSKAALAAGAKVQPGRSPLWLMVREGLIAIDADLRLGPGDAVYLHHALLHVIRADGPASVLLADLRHSDRDFAPETIVVRGFAERQSGIVALLSACPVTGPMRIERPTVTAAYGELLGSAMQSELGLADPATPKPHGDDVVRRASQRLARDPLHPWTLGELAALSHVSTTTLVERFRAATGMTPMHLLRRIRLRNAMDELTGTDAAIATIAHRSGYGSAEAFVRAFRAETGCTLGRWRQSSRGDNLIEANATAATVAPTAPTVMAAQTSR